MIRFGIAEIRDHSFWRAFEAFLLALLDFWGLGARESGWEAAVDRVITRKNAFANTKREEPAERAR